MNVIEKNQLFETIVNLSINHAVTYGLFCIILAVGMGVFASVIRRTVSNYRKKLLLKKAKWFLN